MTATEHARVAADEDRFRRTGGTAACAARGAPRARCPGTVCGGHPPGRRHPGRQPDRELGAEVAAALSSALERVELLLGGGRRGVHSVRGLHEDIARARRIAMVGQQVSRLAAGEVRQMPEALELPLMLRQARKQRGEAIGSHGVSLRQVLAPAAVTADASLLFALLGGLIDWALDHARAQSLVLRTSVHHWPVQALLQCSFGWRTADAALHDDDAQGPTAPRPSGPGHPGAGASSSTPRRRWACASKRDVTRASST